LGGRGLKRNKPQNAKKRGAEGKDGVSRGGLANLPGTVIKRTRTHQGEKGSKDRGDSMRGTISGGTRKQGKVECSKRQGKTGAKMNKESVEKNMGAKTSRGGGRML